MSKEPLEIVRHMWIALREGGVEAALDACASDVRFTSAAGETFHGHEGIRAFFAQFDARAERFVAAPFTFEPVGDGILVAGHRRITGEEGTVAEHLHFTHRVAGGRIVELAAFADRGSACAALGAD